MTPKIQYSSPCEHFCYFKHCNVLSIYSFCSDKDVKKTQECIKLCEKIKKKNWKSKKIFSNK